MSTVLLDEEAFNRTFIGPMRDVTSDVESTADIWRYVSTIPPADLHAVDHQSGRIDYVYRSGDDRFDHVLIPTAIQNVYLVLVVTRSERFILGHHVLDLNEKYGLTDFPETLLSHQARSICAAQGVAPLPPLASAKVGIALKTLDRDH